MMTMVTITRDRAKLQSCSVFVGLPEPIRLDLMARILSWSGQKIPVILPPVKQPTNKEQRPVCQSTWFWQADPQWVLENTRNSAEVFFCEHLLDLD